MKLLFKIALVFLLLLVLLFGGMWFYLDKLAEKGIEEGGTFALDTPVQVDGLDLNIFGGKMSLDGLSVANPTGYGEDQFFELNHATVQVDRNTVMSNVLHVNELHIDGVNLDIIKNSAGTNYGRIMEALEKFSKAEQAEEENGPEEGAKPAKKFVVDHILIENVSATADLAFFGQNLDPVSVTVPPIEVENFGTAENAHSAGDLIKMLLREMLDGVIAEGGGVFPAGLMNDLKSQVANLKGDLMGQGQALIDDARGQAAEQLDAAKKEVENQLDSVTEDLDEKGQKLQDDAKKAVDDALGDGKKKLDSLFGGDKKSSDG